MTTDDFPLFRKTATLVRTVDGDTIVAAMDLGHRVTLEAPLRLVGYNAPETHGPDPRLAADARFALQQLLAGRTLYVETLKDEQSFARYLARVWVALDGQTLTDVAEVMKGRGFDVPRGQ